MFAYVWVAYCCRNWHHAVPLPHKYLLSKHNGLEPNMMSPYWYFLTQSSPEEPDILTFVQTILPYNVACITTIVNMKLFTAAHFYEFRYNTNFHIYIQKLRVSQKILPNASILKALLKIVLVTEVKKFGSCALKQPTVSVGLLVSIRAI
jgi:hypothetical protein